MLEVDRIQVNYGAAPALWDVSLRVGPGELVCVVGPNAAGKSTLINAIAGLNRVASGRILVGGHEVSREPAHRFLAAGVAVVPEGRRLFTSMTVLENLELGSFLKPASAHRKESLDYVCALFPALREKLPYAAGTLSGGQQQMVAIGRALMARPKLLLLDEPSLGLSPLVVLDMFEAIRRINEKGMSILLVEQNVSMAMAVAHRAYVLEEGRVAAEGVPAELLQRPEIRRAYLGLESAAS
jgi:branched-chain amino acid transport system ATP-binding protein